MQAENQQQGTKRKKVKGKEGDRQKMRLAQKRGKKRKMIRDREGDVSSSTDTGCREREREWKEEVE